MRKEKRIEKIYSLTPMQEGMLFHFLEDRESSVYFEQCVFTLKGKVDKALLEKSLQSLIQRHDLLRTLFVYDKIQKPRQVVLEDVNINIIFEDISSLNREQQRAYLEDFKKRDREKGFDLTKDLLTRFFLFKTGEDAGKLIWSFHHIILDGWSTGIFIKELLEIYRALKKGTPARLMPVPQFRDYVRWLAKQDKEEGMHYWQAYLEGYEQQAVLPGTWTTAGSKQEGSYEAREYDFKIDEALTAGLTKTAAENGVTLNTFFLSLWGVLLQKYNHTDDVVFGLVVSGRPPEIAGIENMFGLFINTVPVRIKSSRIQPFSQLLSHVQAKAASTKPYEYMPLADIQGCSALKRKLIHHLMAVENYPVEQQLKEVNSYQDIGFAVENIETFEQTNYDFNILVFPGNCLTIRFMFNQQLYDFDFIKRLESHLLEAVRQVKENPHILIKDIDILPEDEKKLLLEDFNHTKPGRPYPEDMTIHLLFEKQVKQVPDATAVVYEDAAVTYRHLEERGNQVANYLYFEKETKCEDRIGVLMERSLETITAMLGIMKAGGVYIPIPPSLPPERVKHIIEDAGIRVLFSREKHIKMLNDLQWKCPQEFQQDLRHLKRHKTSRVPVSVNPGSLAYIIYTSGSTGKPKGVLIEHSGFTNLIFYQRELFGQDRQTRMSQVSSTGFDAMALEVWPCLAAGACLYIANENIPADAAAVKKWLIRNRITISFQSTIIAEQLLEEEWPAGISLEILITGGDRLTKYPGKSCPFRFYNLYGPTEDTVWTTVMEVKPVPGKNKYFRCPPIGKPAANKSIYILDPHSDLCPIGIPGELCISGKGLARGYLNRPQLTAEKFNRFNRSYKSYRTYIFYKTGDLARWLTDGNIEFLGRIDQQVKLRGFRIELGEIQYRLTKHTNVKDAVVLAREKWDGDKYLCAYIVPADKEAAPTAEELRNHLSLRLPSYMIPSFFIPIKKIPLTRNGKLDKEALPDSYHGTGDYTAPRNEIESQLVEIWSRILKIAGDKISIDSDFFQLGGHSLKATMLVSEIHKELNVKVPLAKIFEIPQIRGMAEYLGYAAEDKFTSVEPAAKKEYYTLSSAQKRLYILQQLDPESTGYNMPAVISLEADIDRERLEETFRKLIARHESLRTSFHMVDNLPVQKVHEAEEVISRWSLVTGEITGANIFEDFIRPFDLFRVPLIRVGLVKTAEAENTLILDLHHIIADGISRGVLIKEFQALYAGEELPSLRLQYKDYAEWQNSRQQQEIIKQQENYWLDVFSGQLPVLDLPIDYKRPERQSFDGASVFFALDEQETRALKDTAREHEVTLYMVILAVFNILLSKLSGREDIIVGTPVAGRRHADLKHIVGMFLNTLAMRNYPSGEKSFSVFLGDVKKQTLEAYENQEYPFEDLVDRLPVTRDTGRNPVFDVMFNLLNQAEYTGEAPVPGLEGKTTHRPVASKFDLNLSAVDYGNTLHFNLEYCTRLFKAETIDRIVGYFKTALSSAASNPGKKISGIRVFPADLEEQKLADFNKELYEGINVGTIQNRLSRNFETNRENIAVEYGSTKLSYAELESRATAAAKRVIARGMEKGSHIGIYMENRLDLIVVVIGILHAECVFVPLDTALPLKRVESMIRAGDIKIVFTDAANEEKLAGICTPVIVSGAEAPDAVSALETVRYGIDDKIYIYFTSGTTGTPKAIIGKNKSLVHFIDWEIDTLGINTGTRVSQFVYPAFDAFLRDIFVPLCSGGTLCIPENSDLLKDRDEIIHWIDDTRVNVIHCVPSLFRVFNSGQLTGEHFLHLKYILLSGETIHPGELKNWYETFGERIQLVNLYGPTETTMTKFYYFIREVDVRRNRIPVGKPMRGAGTIILDANKHVCPPGIVGEIYIRTPFRTFGYLNEPAAGDERFIPNPFGGDPFDLIYRTGDLGRESDGNIEFLGRRDGQVKVRGIRVETGEIETVLRKHPRIKAAAVTAREDYRGEIVLCAYFAAQGPGPETAELREFLSRELPAYMIPSYFTAVEKIPLTPSGKVDRNALPNPDPINAGMDSTPPRNPLESKLAEIWADVLNSSHSSPGIDDNFFDFGGHSLKASVLVSKIHKAFSVKVPLAEVFKRPTIKQIAVYISTAAKESCADIAPVPEKEYYSLSSTQKRLFMLHQMNETGTNFNMPYVVPLTVESDKEKLETAFRKLIRRHESLRTSFAVVGGEAVQRIHEEVDFEIKYYAAVDVFIRPFDLSVAPLMRVGLLEQAGEGPVLLYDMHHIISDGVSQEVLVKEFISLYNGEELPELKLQYKDYAEWQNKRKESGALNEQKTYWLRRFEGEIPVLDLPLDYDRPALQSSKGRIADFRLDIEQGAALKQLALEEGGTLYMVILALYNILLNKLTGGEDIVVGTITAGRGHADLERIIGAFVNLLPIRNTCTGAKTFREFLKEVVKNTTEAFENREYPFEDLVETLGIKRDMERHPLVDVGFTFQGTDGDAGSRERRAGAVEEDRIVFQSPLERVRMDLNLEAFEFEGQLMFSLQYRPALFKEQTIEEFIEYFKKILSSVLENPGVKIGDIHILSEYEKHAIETEINETQANVEIEFDF